MATAAGAIFTQDIEDLPDGVQVGDDAPAKAPIQPPQRKSEAAPVAGVSAGGVRVKVKDFSEKRGTNDKGEWIKTTIHATDGKGYSTFDLGLVKAARAAQEAGDEIALTFTETKYGRDIKTLVAVEREAGAEG
jgi:hypothetical protein